MSLYDMIITFTYTAHIYAPMLLLDLSVLDVEHPTTASAQQHCFSSCLSQLQISFVSNYVAVSINN